MALPYDMALQVWGAQKLHIRYPDAEFFLSSIRVDQGLSSFFGCETCDVPVEAEITVFGLSTSGVKCSYTFDWYVDLLTFIKEVVEAGEGTITSE